MIIIDKKLEAREASGEFIQIGLIGAGEMAQGFVNQVERYMPGMRVAAIYNRTSKRAHNAYVIAGIENTIEVSHKDKLDDAIRQNRSVVAESPDIILNAELIDVVVEMTGAVAFSFDLIMSAFEAGKHVVTFNAELDGTVGPYLQRQARKMGVRYTLGDGDQPGVTMNLYRYVKSKGFKPLVCGNIKGMLDHYRNPTTQQGFADATGMSVDMVTSFADGTKVSLEQASIANATGMKVARRGMLAFDYTGHVDELTTRYDIDELNELGGIVEMVVGAKPGPGVFVFASTEDPVSKRILEYGKLGKGPLYSFYVPYHLLVFDLPMSVARLVDFSDGTLDALDEFSVEVVTTAKTDLKAGSIIDGMGGFATYGECENHSIVQSNALIPIALANGKRLTRDVKKDVAITWADVEQKGLTNVELAYRAFLNI